MTDDHEDEKSNNQERCSPATYEIIGRLAISFLNGKLIGEEPSIDEYVLRAPTTDQKRVRAILEEVIAPLTELRPIAQVTKLTHDH